MNPLRAPVVAILIGLLAACGGGAGLARGQTIPTSVPASSAEVDELIGTLSEADPEARQMAAERLIALGADARPQLLRATESDNPEIRARAAEILRELPWHRAGDPQAVKDILAKYGKMEAGQRFIAVGRLAALPDRKGHEALLRLAVEEPDDRVRWLVVAILREQSMYGPAKRRLQQLDADSPHSAIVLLAGWGWYQVDAARSRQLMEKAVDLEEHARRPEPNAQMLMALSVLVDEALAHADYPRAVELTRRQIAFAEHGGGGGGGRDNGDEYEPWADRALQLLALHAEHGPFDGFASDLLEHHAAAPPLATRRESLYIMARLLQRWHAASAARGVASAAQNADQPARQQRLATGDFLLGRQWNEWALAEYNAAMTQATDGDANDAIVTASAHFRLSQAAIATGDDAAAAQHMDDAMQLIRSAADNNMLLHRQGEGAQLADEAIEAEILYRRWRAARDQGNAADAEKHLSELLKLKPSDIEIAIEVVPALDASQRSAEADKIFEAAYALLKTRLDAEPDNPEHMNNLAWLCARCDRKLDEAQNLARRAVAELPENYAYLDTAAEVHFRKGEAAKAVELEQKALLFRPHDEFMRDQLERFQAKAAPSSRESDTPRANGGG